MFDNELYNLEFLMDMNNMADIWTGRDPYSMSSDNTFEEELTPDSSPQQSWPDIKPSAPILADYKVNMVPMEAHPDMVGMFSQGENTANNRAFFPDELSYYGADGIVNVPIPGWMPSFQPAIGHMQPQLNGMFQSYNPHMQPRTMPPTQNLGMRPSMPIKPSNTTNHINDHRYVQLMPSGKRFAWSQELHESFVSAYESLGESATPKKIMLAMRSAGAPMDGLTRLKVASHFQKYLQKIGRKNCSRKQGRSGPALFAMGFNGGQNELSLSTLSS